MMMDLCIKGASSQVTHIAKRHCISNNLVHFIKGKYWIIRLMGKEVSPNNLSIMKVSGSKITLMAKEKRSTRKISITSASSKEEKNMEWGNTIGILINIIRGSSEMGRWTAGEPTQLSNMNIKAILKKEWKKAQVAWKIRLRDGDTTDNSSKINLKARVLISGKMGQSSMDFSETTKK